MKTAAASLLLFVLVMAGCSGETQESAESFEISGEGIQIEGAWARPASEGRMSAAYFLITNFEDQNDNLISVQSDVAQLVEIHESYELDNGMMGMREVPELEIPSQSTIRLEQGGLHIMLIQVTRTLADGETFELTLNFANHGEQIVEIPIRL
ncbi:MAG: copper chaperone PCu(A)C [Balneolaceae bacterium]|nr:MAG: copper chaperone PCu(A)C [Balneolaceae bacterium]